MAVASALRSMVSALLDSPASPAAMPMGALIGEGSTMSGFEK